MILSNKWLLVVCLILLPIYSQAKQPVKLKTALHSGHVPYYEAFVGTRDVLTITDFESSIGYRDIIEIVLLQQAFALGGYPVELEFVVEDYYARALRKVAHHQLDLIANPVWQDDTFKFENNILVSDAIIEKGQFEAGLYVLPSNKIALKADALTQVQQLTAVSNKNWVVDWRSLEQLQLKRLVSSNQFISMTKMLRLGRVDMMMAPFYNSNDLSFKQDGFSFVPIPNIKVALDGSRHFVINKTRADSSMLMNALNEGLAKLKASGTLSKAYQECGFFNRKVSDWQVINAKLIAANRLEKQQQKQH